MLYSGVLVDALFFVAGALHVLVAPYTKVEESFNLHATHDILMYGVLPDALKNYDHFVFPGVVPRSFVGSVALAYLSTPILWALDALSVLHTKHDIQTVVRLVLASVNAYGLVLVRRAVVSRFGKREGVWFALFSVTQFHLPFWMGRTIPNMFALFPVNVALSLIVGTSRRTTRDTRVAVAILTATAVILRAELAMLIAPLALFLLLQRKVSFGTLLVTGITSALGAVAATVLVDSYFWSQLLMWPELSGILFNVYEGKSAEWGVSPVHTYVTSFLPKMLLGAAPLALLGVLVDSRVRSILYPAVAFIALLSQIGHKEWRFIVYTVPMFNIAAARGADWVLKQRGSWRIARHFLSVGLVGLLVANLAATSFSTYVSHLNYPGGEALSRIHSVVTTPRARIFIDDHAAQTGASLFLQECAEPLGRFGTTPPPRCDWAYFKTEPTDVKVTHAILEPSSHKGGVVLDIVQSYDGLGRRPQVGGGAWLDHIPTVRMRDALWVVAV